MPTSIALKPGLLFVDEGSVAPVVLLCNKILSKLSTDGASVCTNIYLLKCNINYYFCVFT